MKPMLAFKLDAVENARYPVLVSPKIDGIRCIILGGVPKTRTIKDIPNVHIRSALRDLRLPHGTDGELVVGRPNHVDVYRNTVSGVMSHDGEPDWAYYIFDLLSDDPFSLRLASAARLVKKIGNPRIRLVQHNLCDNPAEVLEHETTHLVNGYEGVMGRNQGGFYKQGRSTKGDMALWKLKRFEDGEAVVLGMDEQMQNTNPAKRNALGRLERSSHAENMVPAGTMGALKVRGVGGFFDGVKFEIGTGFSDEERQDIWDNFETHWKNTIVKYKHLPVGVKDKPRHAVYLGPRTAEDAAN